jgi:hypothetical protein
LRSAVYPAIPLAMASASTRRGQVTISPFLVNQSARVRLHKPHILSFANFSLRTGFLPVKPKRPTRLTVPPSARITLSHKSWRKSVGGADRATAAARAGRSSASLRCMSAIFSRARLVLRAGE